MTQAESDDDAPFDPPADRRIVGAAIHPAIGVARVGNSRASGTQGFFIGPEVTDPPPMAADQVRDSSGALKRQAARFRVYGYNAAGQVVRELTHGRHGTHVRWRAHLANRKAEWYAIKNALDLPENADLKLPLRNAHIQGEARAALVIDPGPRTISGPSTSGKRYQFDTGTFQGEPVPLGEIRTDRQGRLLVLGGFGRSGSPSDAPVFNPDNPFAFNNADGWYDDISDGPVDAEVELEGRSVPVLGAWAVVAPPDYAPDLVAWRTLYDQITDLYLETGRQTLEPQVSFSRHVLPSLRRMSRLQWVNAGFAAYFGHGGPMSFEDPDLVAKLCAEPYTDDRGCRVDPWQELRRTVFNSFRPSDTKVFDPRAWPWIYGDAFVGSIAGGSPRLNLMLSRTQEHYLRRWVAGDFENDWPPTHGPARRLGQVPVDRQPAMLDKAALHFCIAHAFNPGSEMTWIMRHSMLYDRPFRIRRHGADTPLDPLGPFLTQADIYLPAGPLSSQRPGDLTRWMALPWQMDAAWCRGGVQAQYDPNVPTFWAPRVPNQVLTDDDYRQVMDSDLSTAQRVAAFRRRRAWLRSLHGSDVEQIHQMLERFARLGVIEERPGPRDVPELPRRLWVENLPSSESRDG